MRVGAELDSVAAETYRRNFPEISVLTPSKDNPVQGDVSKLTGEDVLDAGGISRGQVGLVVGGPPCQGFSYMGYRRSDDPRNKLYRHFVRLVEELEPAGYLFENVPGITTMDGGNVYEDLIASLELAGYSATPFLLNAASFGVPQLRTRLFVVGARRHRPVHLEEGPLSSDHYVTSLEALDDLPLDPAQASAEGSYALPYRRVPTADYAVRMRNGNTVARNCVPTIHSTELRARIARLAPGEVDPSSRHRRLNPLRPAPTLRAASRTRTSCRPIHPSQPRVITPREAARLCSFPDEFWLPDTIAPAHMLLDSVPPLLAHHLACALADGVPFALMAGGDVPNADIY